MILEIQRRYCQDDPEFSYDACDAVAYLDGREVYRFGPYGDEDGVEQIPAFIAAARIFADLQDRFIEIVETRCAHPDY